MSLGRFPFIVSVLIAFLCQTHSLFAAITGSADLGPAYIRIDVLESGKTVDTLKMGGVQGTATVAVYKGLCIKPAFLLGWGDGNFASGSLAVGYYIPVTNKLSVLPNIGGTASYLRTFIDFAHPIFPGLYFEKTRERFRSETAFLGLDVYYSINDVWTLRFAYQYGWSRSHTKLTHERQKLFSGKEHSCGANYGLAIDYRFTPNFSVMVGAAYNIMLSKEKHGLRGCGAKIAAAYRF